MRGVSEIANPRFGSAGEGRRSRSWVLRIEYGEGSVGGASGESLATVVPGGASCAIIKGRQRFLHVSTIF